MEGQQKGGGCKRNKSYDDSQVVEWGSSEIILKEVKLERVREEMVDLKTVQERQEDSI
jgi:hypothetical protein